MIRLRAKKSAVWCLVTALVLPVTAFAQPTAAPAPNAAKLDEARVRYDRGVKLYDENQYESARIEFERAYELAPSYRILYNLGLVYEQGSDYAGALKKFQQYLEQGGSQVPDDRRTEVQREIAKIKGRVATIAITVNEPGVDVAVDDVPVGKSPLPAPVEVNPGRRRVSGSKPGKLPTTRIVEVAGSDRAVVTIELTDVPVQRVVVERTERRVPWGGWAATAGLGVAAGVFGFLTLHEASKLDDDKSVVGQDHSKLTSDAHTLRAYTVTADILTVGAVAAGAASLYYTIKWGKEANASDERTGAPAAEVSAGVGPGSVVLRGSF